MFNSFPTKEALQIIDEVFSHLVPGLLGAAAKVWRNDGSWQAPQRVTFWKRLVRVSDIDGTAQSAAAYFSR
jgi:hypothetical protein